MKRIPLPILILLAAAVMGALLLVSRRSGERMETGIVHARIAGHELRLLVADEPGARTLGLSGRDGLAEYSGMLFVFPSDGRHGIWMKGMRFAIDILWLDREGTVVYLEEDISPDTYPSVFVPQTDARYVVEVRAGAVREMGIVLGQRFDF